MKLCKILTCFLILFIYSYSTLANSSSISLQLGTHDTTKYTSQDYVTSTTMDSTELNSNSQDSMAQQWGLTTLMWGKYLEKLAGTSGHWYKSLDPAEVLGIHAQTEVEREYFADLVVKQQYQRIERELSFQRAVNNAWEKLYPNLQPIKYFKISNAISSKDS